MKTERYNNNFGRFFPEYVGKNGTPLLKKKIPDYIPTEWIGFHEVNSLKEIARIPACISFWMIISSKECG